MLEALEEVLERVPPALGGWGDTGTRDAPPSACRLSRGEPLGDPPSPGLGKPDHDR